MSELEEVVGGADDRAFGPHLLEATHQELAKAARLFDLPKYRLGQLLTQSVGTVVTFSFDPALAATLSTLEHRYGLNLASTANEKREPTEARPNSRT